jgi:hypothetical protein
MTVMKLRTTNMNPVRVIYHREKRLGSMILIVGALAWIGLEMCVAWARLTALGL